MWPSVHTWESYECDNTTNPEWWDTTEIRLNDVRGGDNEWTAGDARSEIRLYIQVMDRDKEKALKLGTLSKGSIPLRNLKVLEGPPPTEDEMSGGEGRKKKSKSEKF